MGRMGVAGRYSGLFAACTGHFTTVENEAKDERGGDCLAARMKPDEEC